MERKIADIIKFIRECRRSGVMEAEISGVRLKFGEPQTRVTTKHKPTIELPPRPEEEKDQELRGMEEEIRTRELEQLKLEDPLAYEEKIIEVMNNGGDEGNEENSSV